jgi:hypothetical protein
MACYYVIVFSSLFIHLVSSRVIATTDANGVYKVLMTCNIITSVCKLTLEQKNQTFVLM